MSFSNSNIINSLGNVFRRYFGASLYRNSAFFGISRVMNSSIGLIFWIIAAKYYPAASVGIAVALISSVGLITTFSRFGFDFSIIRFMPVKDKNAVFSTCLSITAIASIIISSAYLLLVDYISPAISFIRDYAFIFVLFAFFSSTLMTSANTFLSLKRGDYYLAQNVMDALRIPALIPLAVLGPMGIFLSAAIAIFASSLVAFYLIFRVIKLKFKFSREFLRDTSRLSSINYISDLFYDTPTLILPLMILNLLGSQEVAQYYIAMAIGNIILLIPVSVSVCFFVEGSHGTDMKKELFRALKFIYILLVPAVICIYFFGGFVLQSFGSVYAQSLDLLRIYSLSSFFVAIFLMSISILNVNLMVGRNVKLSIIRFVILLGLNYVFILNFGLIGVGYAWLVGHMLLSLGIAALAKVNGWI